MGLEEQVLTTGSRLSDLAKKHGTDKYPWYTEFYDLLLRGRHVETILEIGVLHGSSLNMWREYFPGSQVWGLDIKLSAGVECMLTGDQSDKSVLEYTAAFCGPFDLIVDDGSHKPADQVLGAITLVPHLREGGLYIIEDVNPPVSNVVDRLPFPNQYVECRVPGSNAVGRCVVIQSL